VLIVGGGVAGSVAAKFAAKGGLKTLFIEKKKTPRNKPCSGIQFKYLEKIIGEKIPRSRLCNNQLNRVAMYLPDGRRLVAPFRMLNFMRKPFDDWLNTVAKEHGAEFRDECEYVGHEETPDHVIVMLRTGGNSDGKAQVEEQVKARYLVEASGLMPAIRRKMRPDDFADKFTGGTLNYYIDGTADMDPHILYQFWNMEWNNAMFAWAYTKTLDDGKDYWVVGTGCNDTNIKERQEAFYKYVKDKFHVVGEVVKKEGYTVTIKELSKERIWLGKGRVLVTGDAAGLLDQVRGVGMDIAALSGRLVAKAMVNAGKKGTNALDEYTKLMKSAVKQTQDNQLREITAFKTNDELQAHLNKGMMKTGMALVMQAFLNLFRPAEKQKLLPP
jgi:flavin-dependent dehydrogenase